MYLCVYVPTADAAAAATGVSFSQYQAQWVVSFTDRSQLGDDLPFSQGKIGTKRAAIRLVVIAATWTIWG